MLQRIQNSCLDGLRLSMLHLGRSQMLPTILNLYKRTGNDSNQSISHMMHVRKFFVSFFLKSKHLRRDKQPRAVSRLRQRGEGLQEDHQVTLNWGGGVWGHASQKILKKTRHYKIMKIFLC